MMTEERRGQIALLLIKDRLRGEGVRLKPDMKREIGNQASRIGVPFDEMVKFVEDIVRELVEEVFTIPVNDEPTTAGRIVRTRNNPDHNPEM